MDLGACSLPASWHYATGFHLLFAGYPDHGRGIATGSGGIIYRPSAENVMASTLSQFSTIGLLVLVLAGMNTVAGERATGTAELVLARSVSTIPMMSAKWAALMTRWSFLLRLDLAVPHITYQLIGPLEWGSVTSGGAYMLYGWPGS